MTLMTHRAHDFKCMTNIVVLTKKVSIRSRSDVADVEPPNHSLGLWILIYLKSQAFRM